MENMICFECISKHLSAALSYAKEVMSGHGKGSDLDHRPDLLGEIVNAQHHLQQMDVMLFSEISEYRKNLQSRGIEITSSDIDFLRSLWIKAEQKEAGKVLKERYYYIPPEPVDIVYIAPKNSEYFRLSLESIKKYLRGYNKVYVLQPEFDCSGIDGIQIINQSLSEFASSETLSADFVVMPENTAFLKQTDAQKIPPTYSMQHRPKEFMSFINNLRKKGVHKSIYCCDFIKPQPVNKAAFNAIQRQSESGYILTEYFYLSDFVSLANDLQMSVQVNKAICCGTKSGLKVKHFVRWTENGFEHLRKYLDEKTKNKN